MAVLLDYNFSGGNADPDPVLSTPSGRGTFQRLGGVGKVSANNTFSIGYYAAASANANHRSTVYFSAVGGATGGAAVCIDPSSGACYFLQSSNLIDITIYYFNGGAFTVVGVILGVTFNTTDPVTLERVAASDVLRVYVAGVQVGTDIVDANLTGGQPGITGYDDAQLLSRVIFEDDSAGAASASAPAINRSARFARMLHF